MFRSRLGIEKPCGGAEGKLRAEIEQRSRIEGEQRCCGKPEARPQRVRTAERKRAEDVNQANDTLYGLNGSVWTADLTKGEAVARQLTVGIAYVNNHSFAGVVPQIPWTGTGHTGTGIAASRHAYGTFTRPRTVIVDKGTQPDVFWFPNDAELGTLGHAVAELGLGRYSRVLKLLPLLKKRTRSILGFGR